MGAAVSAARASLAGVVGPPGGHRDDLQPLEGWLAEHDEDEAGLEGLLASTAEVALHPFDADRLQAAAVAVRQAASEEAQDAAWLAIVFLAASLRGRYSFGYPTDLGRKVRELRKLLTPTRGPPIYGQNGAFRRGDLVSRPVHQGEQIVAVHDGLFVEAEPPSEHARTYGRMAAVRVLSPTEAVDRWFLDHFYPGLDFGRPL